MAFKTVQDLSADTTIALGGMNSKTGKANPTSVEGYFLGSREVNTGDGKSTLHFFQTQKGNVAVWGSADTNKKLAIVPKGAMTRVTFKEKVKVAKGFMKKFEVAVDDENTIEVSGMATGNNDKSGDAEDYDHSDETAGDYGIDQEESIDEDAAQQAALQAAERKAKVAAMLKKGKAS